MSAQPPDPLVLAAPTRPPWVPDGCEPLRELGRGASGAVYLARERTSEREVAIKRLLREGDRIGSRRFRREQRLLSRLEHPGIVRVYDVINTGGEVALVLEFVPGPTLRELLCAARLNTPDALEVLRQLADALEHAHQRGVVHRDLSPANILLTPAGECKLTDFGIAKLIDATRPRGLSSFRTRTGAILGTATYISPEAAAGVVRLDRRADIYSLAVLAYELLVGSPPFPAQPDLLLTLEAHIESPVPRPTLLAPGFSPDVETVLLRALEKRPRRRQSSVAAFWEQLEAAASAAWPDWRVRANLAVLVAGRTQEPPQAADTAESGLPTKLDEPAVTQLPRSLGRAGGPIFRPAAHGRWATLGLAVLAGLIAAVAVLVLTQIR